jgi:hypothetical protein
MNTITISRSCHLIGATGIPEALRAIAQSIVKITATGPVAALTDNSGGIASDFLPLNTTRLADSPVSGTNLATPADVTTNLISLQNALKTVYVKANTLAAAIGLAGVTYNGGGTDGSGTIAAITTAVTGAATGGNAANANALVGAYNDAVYNLAILTNRIVEATGDDPILVNPSNVAVHLLSTVPVLTSDPGAASAPGVAAADWVAQFVIWKNAIAAIAEGLNSARTPGTVRVIAVR